MRKNGKLCLLLIHPKRDLRSVIFFSNLNLIDQDNTLLYCPLQE